MATVQEVLEKIWTDPAFKAKLFASPNAVLEELGMEIPAGTNVKIYENTPHEMNYVMPNQAEMPAGYDPEQTDAIIGKIIKKAWADPAFKQRLIADPKPAISAVSGVEMPQSLKIRILEDKPGLKNLILPVNPKSEELSDADLEAVAGGALSKGNQAATGCGVASGAAGIASAALAFTIVGAIGAGVASGLAGVGSAIGGAVASGNNKC